MFRFFERIVDPFQAYPDADTPPSSLLPFLKDYFRPFKGVIAGIVCITIFVAATEIGLIFYAGWIVDRLSDTSPSEVFADHGLSLLALAILVLAIRPAVMLIEAALMNQSLMPNLGTLIRWRSHRHVLHSQWAGFKTTSPDGSPAADRYPTKARPPRQDR